jgi:hypothetical protein
MDAAPAAALDGIGRDSIGALEIPPAMARSFFTR